MFTGLSRGVARYLRYSMSMPWKVIGDDVRPRVRRRGTNQWGATTLFRLHPGLHLRLPSPLPHGKTFVLFTSSSVCMEARTRTVDVRAEQRLEQ